MAKSVFSEKAVEPTEAQLPRLLGGTWSLWSWFSLYIQDNCERVTYSWTYNGKVWGWTLMFSSKKQPLVYLTPGDKLFLVSFVFNDKARAMARRGGFSMEVLECIEAGKENIAGQTFDLEINTTEDLEVARRLLEIKKQC